MAANSNSLALRQIFGISSSVVNNLSFFDDDTVVYVAGHNIVLYNKSDKRQRFIQSQDAVDIITAFASGCGKRLAAVAIRGDSPQIHVYDLRTFRKKKTLVALESSLAKDFVCMEFSGDDQLLLTLSGAPEWNLSVWNWSKAKLLASAQVSTGPPMSFCSFSPLDTSMICVSGKGALRFYRVAEKDMRPLPDSVNLSTYNFTSHCWLRVPVDHLIAGTESGALLLFRSGEYLTQLGCSPNSSEYPISSIIATANGFIVGTRPGTFLVIKFDDSISEDALYGSQFSIINKISCTNEMTMGTILRMALSPNDETLCAITSDSQLLCMPAVQMPNLTTDQIKYLQSSFHGPKAIVGMDVCVRKPLIITACKDYTLRIWNYQTSELELLKLFPEDMYSVSLHPTGLHCAIGFTDKLRVYHILVDDIRICLEVSIKNCRECKFSKGGNMIAAANGNSICVYDFFTGEKVADLRGHNGKVRSIYWLDSGHQLLSCGQDGAVYIWEVEGGRRIGEFVHKGTMYTSAVCTNDLVFAVGSDRVLKELDIPELTLTKEIDCGILLSFVQVSALKALLFASTGENNKPGTIRAYVYPVTGDYVEYTCMGTVISQMAMTEDGTFLMVADESGCLVVMEVKDKLDRYQRNITAPPELAVLETWTDEILVTKTELEDRNTVIADLRQKVDELKMHNEYQLKLKDMNYSEKIKEVTDKYVQELDQAKMKLELLTEERSDSELEYIEKTKQMSEKHQHDLQEIETKYQAQIMEQVEKYQKLARNRDAQLARLEDQRRLLIQSHEKYVDELTVDFEKKLAEDRHGRLQFEEEKSELEKELVETKRQLEDDVDTEIEHLRKHFEDKLTTARETTLKYKGENGIMKKKYAVLQKDLEDQKDEVIMLQNRERELHEQIKVLEKEVSAHKKEIKQRDTTIGEKEKRIYELKKKNQELDKFKFVLDFKIRELKKQIEPRQLEIVSMKEKIKEMDTELDKFHNLNSNLDSMIGTLRKRIDELQNENRSARIKAKLQENSINTFKGDIQGTVAHILSPPDLRSAVEKLYEVHGASGKVRPRIDPDVEQEYSRHKEFLQRSVQQLKSALEDEVDQHAATNRDLMTNNLKIIEDINKQRESNRVLRQSVQTYFARIRHLAQAQFEAKKAAEKVGAGQLPPSLPTSGEPVTVTPDAKDEQADPLIILEKNRLRISALRAAIVELESRVALQKSYSREVLPPMDGIAIGKLSGEVENEGLA